MKKLTAFLLVLVFVIAAGCTVRVVAPAQPSDQRAIQRSNEAFKELDANTK